MTDINNPLGLSEMGSFLGLQELTSTLKATSFSKRTPGNKNVHSLIV